MVSVKPATWSSNPIGWLTGEFPHHCHQFVDRLVPLARFDGSLHAAVRMIF
jgi:hypothetical protein